MEGKQWAGIGLGVLAGAVIGGTIALLFAPKSGREMRALIAEKVDDAGHKVGEKFSEVRHVVGDKISGEEHAKHGGDGARRVEKAAF